MYVTLIDIGHVGEQKQILALMAFMAKSQSLIAIESQSSCLMWDFWHNWSGILHCSRIVWSNHVSVHNSLAIPWIMDHAPSTALPQSFKKCQLQQSRRSRYTHSGTIKIFSKSTCFKKYHSNQRVFYWSKDPFVICFATFINYHYERFPAFWVYHHLGFNRVNMVNMVIVVSLDLSCQTDLHTFHWRHRQRPCSKTRWIGATSGRAT